ncbi:MAG: hypothetical protein HZC28_00815 [Spirochaetes bacterium]|nr:hypothetical protein [Spirochaetota bacterium]
MVVDGLTPDVSNITCWQNANFTGIITNGVLNYDNLVSYRFYSTNTASAQRFYYVYTNNASVTVDATMTSTTNNYLLNQNLTAGTNYFIVRARNEVGTWGSQFVFTNVYTAPPFYVDIGANTPPDRYVVNNANNVVLMQLRMQAGAVGYHVFYLKFKANGTLNDVSDFSFNSLKLFLDDGNGVFDGSEPLLCGDRAFTADDGYVTFDNFTNTISANAETNIFIVGSLSGTAASNKTFYLSFEGVNAMSNIAVDNAATNVFTGIPVYANTNIITLLGTIYANYGPQNPSQSIINPDDQNVPMLQMALGAGPEEDVDITSITISANGSGDDMNHIAVNGVRLVNDVNTNGIYDAGDVPVSGGQTYSADNGSISFTGLNLLTSAGTTNYLLVVYDFKGTAPSQADFQMQVNSVSGTGINSSGSVSASGTPLIGSKKVVLLDLTGPQYFTGTPFVTPAFVTNTNVIISIIPDENTYTGGTNYTDVLFTKGTGTNVNRVDNNLVMTLLSIFAGNTNTIGLANSGNNNYTYLNNGTAAKFQSHGVVTKYIGMTGRTANRTMYISVSTNRTDLGANFWQGYGVRAISAPAVNTSYSLSNLSIAVKSNDGVYINPRNTRARINTTTYGSGFRSYIGNASTAAVDYTVNTPGVAAMVYVGAVGYATAIFYSTNMPFATGFSNALRMTWSNDVTGGGTITMRVRGADTLVNLASATWYTVNKNSTPNALTNAAIRYVQYEAAFTAAAPEGGTVSPKLVSFSIDYGWKNYPIVYTVQPGGKTNYATYQTGSGTGTFTFTNNIADTNGAVDVYATARDYYGNWASNVYVGTFIYDRSQPNITNLKCYTSPSYSFEISNNALFYDEIVSFNVSNKVDSPSGVYYYYTLDGNPDTNSISNALATYSTNTSINDIGLPEGTNYFHVRARTFYGIWGNEAVFTNIFKRPALSIDAGSANPPATNVIIGTGDVAVLQMRLRAGPASGIIVSNLSFTAAGSAHDVNDISLIRIYDDNGNGILDAGDTLLASNVYNADNGLVTFTNLNYTFAANQTRYLTLIYDTKTTATIGSTFFAGITNLSSIVAWPPDYSDIVSNIQYFPLWGNTNTFFRTAAVSLSAGANNPSSTNVASNTTDLLMLQFTATMNNGESVKLSNITIRATGTGDDTFDVSAASVRLYFDNNANGAIDGGDTLLGSGSYNSNDGVFSVQNINRTLTPNSVTNFIVVQSFSGNATNGKWFRVSLDTNTAFTVYGMTTGNPITVSGAPVSGGTVNIGVDTTPPYFSPYGGFVSLDPSPLTNSLYIYVQVDEKVKSTNGPGATVTNYPIIRVIQSNASQCTTNTAVWISGLTNGPFTNSYAVQNFDGKAYVYAEGYDLASPSNWTNMLVGTFMVDVTYPASFITNYITYDTVTNTNINVMMYALETNVTVSINVTTASNGGSVVSYISNRSIAGSNYTFTNVALSNLEGYTNWLTLTVRDAASNSSNSASIGVIYATTPVIIVSKTRAIYTPLDFYTTPTNELLPGGIILYTIAYTNAGVSLATNIVVEEYLPANLYYLTGSATGGDSYSYATNGVYAGYTPSGTVDTNINRIKFSKTVIPAGASGSVNYRAVLR